MLKDILGQILDMKKGQGNIVVKIELEPSAVEGDEETEMKVQGLAPAPGDKKDDKEEMSDSMMLPEDLMGEDEMHNMKRKKKQGVLPKNLSDRAKMDAIED